MRIWARIDRYLTRELWGAYILGLGAFTTVFLLNLLFDLAQQTIEKRVPFRLVMGFILAGMPEILLFTMPMAALLAVLVAVGRLAVQHELVAARASTLSPGRIFRPVGVLALGGFLIAAGMAHYLQPLGKDYERKLVQEILRTRDVSREIDPGVFYDRLPRTVLYADAAAESPAGRVFEGIFLYRESPTGDRSDLILAQRGQAEFDRETGRIHLRLDRGEQHTLDPSHPEVYQVFDFPHLTLSYGTDAGFRIFTEGERWDAAEFAGFDLYREIQSLAAEAATTESPGRRIALAGRIQRARVEWHRRWSLPAAILLLSFAAFPLAARTQRGGRFAGLTQSLVIILFFWVLYTTGFGFAEGGQWPAWLGLWLANLVTLAWALLLWLRPENPERRGLLRRGLKAAVRPLLRLRRRRTTGRGRASEDLADAAPGQRFVGPSRLDRYLSTGYLRMLVAVLVVLVALTLVVEFVRVTRLVDPELPDYPLSDILAFLRLSILGQLQLLLPISALAAVGISLSGLARGGEVVAMKASGVGPVRIAAPLLAVTLGLSLLYGLAQETLVPAAERESRRVYDRIRGRTSAGDSTTGRRWIVGEEGRIWGYLDWEPRSGTLLAPTLLDVDLRQARLRERIEAGAAEPIPGGWAFEGGWRRAFPAEAAARFEPVAERAVQAGETPELFGANQRTMLFGRRLVEQMTIQDLWQHLQRTSRAGVDPSALQVGLYQKFVTPLLSFLLVLTGIPLVVSGWARRGSLYGFGVSLLITIAFWALWAVSTSFGREGVLSPVLAAFVPPALLLMAGSWLLVRAR
jgi:lipopolysaccharide export system permease protein